MSRAIFYSYDRLEKIEYILESANAALGWYLKTEDFIAASGDFFFKWLNFCRKYGYTIYPNDSENVVSENILNKVNDFFAIFNFFECENVPLSETTIKLIIGLFPHSEVEDYFNMCVEGILSDFKSDDGLTIELSSEFDVIQATLEIDAALKILEKLKSDLVTELERRQKIQNLTQQTLPQNNIQQQITEPLKVEIINKELTVKQSQTPEYLQKLIDKHYIDENNFAILPLEKIAQYMHTELKIELKKESLKVFKNMKTGKSYSDKSIEQAITAAYQNDKDNSV